MRLHFSIALAAALSWGIAATGCSSNDQSTPDAGCPSGTTSCGSACVETSIDPANCGACGTACPAGEVCSSGTCALDCGGGTTKCGSSCIDTKVDANNCGACGHACASGEVCSNGACAATCAANYATCGGDGGAPYCAHVADDVHNCGACGAACAAGQTCSSGACACPTNVADLCGTGTTAYCTSLTTDPGNCSACGTACGAGLGCGAGLCGAPESVLATANPNLGAHVAWAAPPGPGLAVTNYTVVSQPATTTVTTTSTSADFTNLTLGTTYTFIVTPNTSKGAGLIGVSNPLTVKACANVTRQLTGVDHVSLNYSTSGGSWNDNTVRAYISPPGFDITTWIEFNTQTAGIPATASVVSMTMTLNTTTSYTSPNVEVQYCSTHNWAFATATAALMPRGVVVTPASVPALGLTDYTIDVGANNWTSDLQAGTITFGVTNTNTVYSFAYYDGTRAGIKPVLSITTCE